VFAARLEADKDHEEAERHRERDDGPCVCPLVRGGVGETVDEACHAAAHGQRARQVEAA